MKFTMWGSDHEIYFVKENYCNNNNTAIMAIVVEEDGFEEPWCNVTVNLDKALPKNRAYLDTNNCSKEIIDWLFKEGHVEQIGVGFSGYCQYPLVEFSEEFLEEVCK